MAPPQPPALPGDLDAPPTIPTLSITNRLRWSYLISSTLPLLLVGAILILVLFQAQQRTAYTEQQAAATQIVGNITTFLYDLEQQLLRVGRDLRPNQPDLALQVAASRLVNSSPDLRAITIFDAAGTEVAQATSDLMKLQGTPALSTTPALVTDALILGRGNRTTIVPGGDGQPVFQIVLPVREPQSPRIAGVLVAEVSTARIRQIMNLATQGKGKIAYLIDPQQHVLLSDQRTDWQAPPDLSRLFVENESVGEYPGGNGQTMLGARTAITPVTDQSWSVIVEQPSSDFFGEVYQSLLFLAGLVALVGMLALAWALLQARSLVEPIRALTAGAQDLAEGRLDHRIVVSPGDELGQLAQTFNAMAVRLQRSLHEIERQNEHLRHGLVLARDIQQGLLPHTPPWRSEALRVYGRSVPANEVGGDFYSYMALPGGQAAVAIGDISGKGVAAALLMALTSSTLESQAHFIKHPGKLLEALHMALSPRLRANQMNAALLVAVFSTDASTVTMANAGMIAPLLVRADRTPPVLLEVGGLPIGTALAGRYQELTVTLNPGDALYLLSDGIVEAHNPMGELFGFERLEDLVAALPPALDEVALVRAILDAVLAFVGTAEPHDDMTIIVTRAATNASLALGEV
ncbi:MAG: SpoIIE family protein phosphatase [Oscillochloridaceae bacterium umkhey_bin13]